MFSLSIHSPTVLVDLFLAFYSFLKTLNCSSPIYMLRMTWLPISVRKLKQSKENFYILLPPCIFTCYHLYPQSTYSPVTTDEPLVKKWLVNSKVSQLLKYSNSFFSFISLPSLFIGSFPLAYKHVLISPIKKYPPFFLPHFSSNLQPLIFLNLYHYFSIHNICISCNWLDSGSLFFSLTTLRFN